LIQSTYPFEAIESRLTNFAYEVVGSPIPLKSKVKVAILASTPYITALSLMIENVSYDGMSAVKFTRPKLKELSSNV